MGLNKTITSRFFLFSIFFLSFISHSQIPDICWQQNYGGSGGEISVCTEVLPSGGMLMAFGSTSNDIDIVDTVTWHGNTDVVVMQLDACGKVEWQRVYGGTGNDHPYSMKRTADGSIYLGCETYSNNGEAGGHSTLSDMWGMKLDASGNIIWSRAIGTSSHHEYGGYMDVAKNGDMFLTAIVGSSMWAPYYHANNDAYIIRLDGATGTTVWHRAYGGSGFERGYGVTGTHDNGGILLSVTNGNNGDVSGLIGSSDLWVVKFDSTNAIQWQKCLGGTGAENGQGTIVQARDSSYFIVSATQSTDSMAINNHGGNDIFIVKLDTLGNVLWTNCYGGSGNDLPGLRGGTCAIETSDSNLIVVANTNSNDGDVTTRYLNQDIWLFKVDKNTGAIMWNKTFGSDSLDLAFSVKEISPNNFIVGATTDANNSVDFDQAQYGNRDAWLLRISESCLGQLPDSVSYISDSTTCHLSNGTVGISVFNRLLPNIYDWSPITSSDTIITNVAAGTYSVTVTDFIGCSDTFAITVINVPDTIPPTFICLNDTIIGVDATCSYTIPNFLTSPNLTITDNCDALSDLTIYQIPIEFTVINTDTTVWIYAVDTSGNIDSCSFHIDLVDNTPPTIFSCASDSSLYGDANCSILLPDFTTSTQISFSDNCSANVDVTITQSPVAGTSITDDTEVWLFFEDEAGNRDSCSLNVTVLDSIPPVITSCMSNTTVTADVNCFGILGDYTSLANYSVTDNCTSTSNLMITQIPSAGTIISDTTTVTIYIFDESNNVDSCTFEVVVVDFTPPIFINCPQNATLNMTTGTCEATVPDYLSSIEVEDNCSDSISISRSQTPASGTVINTNTLVTIYATDASGNIDSCQFLLSLVDTISPLISNCIENITLNVDANCQATLADYTTDQALGVTDNCSSIGNGLIITQNPSAGTVISENTEVWVFATDASGNRDSCSFIATVKACDITIMEAFSPTGNGQNEYFYIENLDAFPNTSVVIYNRWGSEVFQSDDYQNDWNGKSQSKYNIAGDELPEGTYFYILTLGGDETNPNYGKVYKGYVYLKR